MKEFIGIPSESTKFSKIFPEFDLNFDVFLRCLRIWDPGDLQNHPKQPWDPGDPESPQKTSWDPKAVKINQNRASNQKSE